MTETIKLVCGQEYTPAIGGSTYVPSKHFHNPPYRAELFNPENGWSGVMNASGFNCVTILEQPGAKMVSFQVAERIAATWNSGVLEHVEP